jgi:fimbrial chaperone protein
MKWRVCVTLAAALSGLALCQAGIVSASSFTVTPVQVALSASNRSVLLTLVNESSEDLRFQMSAFAWQQGPLGEIQLAPTQDIVFFPALLALGPGKERKIRVGSTIPAGATERTYRIFVEELPPARVSKASSGGSQVRVLTKMGVPIFVQPARPEPAGKIEVQGPEDGHVRFSVRNTGNVHFLLQDVRVRGLGPSGETVLDRVANGWYVLAGGVRDYEETISPEACARIGTLVFEARTDGEPFETRQPLPPGSCGPPAGSGPPQRSE